VKESDFDRYAETFFDIMHEGHDYESVAKGYGEYYYDCLPEELNEPVLDVGCGSGHFLRFLEIAGYHKGEGIELSLQQAKLARRHVNLEVHEGDVADLLKRKPEGYAAICMNDVLEHIPKDIIIDFLSTLRAGLKDDGVLVVNVPQVAGLTTVYSRYIDFTHQQVFTEMSLRQVLMMAGFEDIRFVAEKWPLKWTPKHLSYRFARWTWHKILRLIYFIEMPGEKHPTYLQTRLMAVAKK